MSLNQSFCIKYILNPSIFIPIRLNKMLALFETIMIFLNGFETVTDEWLHDVEIQSLLAFLGVQE